MPDEIPEPEKRNRRHWPNKFRPANAPRSQDKQDQRLLRAANLDEQFSARDKFQLDMKPEVKTCLGYIWANFCG